MKYLIIQKIAQHVPVEAWSKLLPMQFRYLDTLEKEKRIDLAYHLIGQQGNMLIVNAASEEDLSRIISEDPMFFYSERQIYPLTTREMHKKHVKQLLQK